MIPSGEHPIVLDAHSVDGSSEARPDLEVNRIDPENGETHRLYWDDSDYSGPYVYVLQGDPDTPIKVGTALNVATRIASLQTGNPVRLRLLAVICGGGALEKAIHWKLRRERVIGEWFKGSLTDEFLAWAEDYTFRAVQAHYWADIYHPHDFPAKPRQPKKALRLVPKKHAPVTTRFVDPDEMEWVA